MMSYSIDIITKADQNTSNWAGGTTTELTIYPKDAQYSQRNFSWRLSSARVQQEKSDFTSLPGFWRYIMVIEGEMDLEHMEHHSIHLGPYDKDSFSGGWATKSRGKVRDFNLMVANGYKGEIEGLDIVEKINIEESNLYDSYGEVTQAFYCTEGKVEIEINGILSALIGEGELAVINISGRHGKVTLKNMDHASKVIRAVIFR